MRYAWLTLCVALSAIGAALGPGSGEVRGDISIAPAFVEVTLDRGRPAGRFDIANLGDREERYRINALHFNFTREGSLQRLSPDEHSLAPWIKFNPTELTVAPKTSRVVRFVIIPRGNLVPGEYWAAMELENLNTQTGKGTDAAGRELKIEVVTTIMVPIFGTAGNVRYEGTVESLKAGPDPKTGTVLEAHVANRGDGRLLLKGEYEVQDASGKVVDKGPLGYAYVLPGMDRLFSNHVGVAMPAGNYAVKVKYESPQLKQPLMGKTTLTLASPSVPPSEPPPAKSPEKPPATAREGSPRATEVSSS